MNGRMVVKGSMIAGAMVALSGMTGCLSQGEYDRVAEAYNSCKARTAELERERDEARMSLSQLQSSMGQGEGTLSALTARNADLERQLAQARNDLQNFEGKLGQISFGPIDAGTSNELERLAQQFPNLISFDAERGMLRVASDMTFASGSTVVNDNAKQALSRLADILKSGSAAQYDVIVEGHTDSQRIGSAATRAHSPSNRHLSTNRANAVIEVLASMGVPNSRLMAAGWGEHRPTVTNSANGNTPANRRVELYLAKLSSGNAAAATPGNLGNDVVMPNPAPRPAPAPDNIK